MSGGSLDYSSSKIDMIIEDLYYAQETYLGAKDVEKEIKKLIEVLSVLSNNIQQVELYLSGDIAIERMQERWKEF